MSLIAAISQFLLEVSEEAIVVTDPSHRVTGFNAAAIGLLGKIPLTVVDDWSATFGFFLSDGATKFPATEFPKGQSNKTARLLIRNDSVPEGTFVSVRAIELPEAKGYAYRFTDLRHNREIERSLRDSEAQLRFLFDGHPDALWIVDNATSTVVEVNEATTGMYGYSREEVIGKKFTEFQCKDNRRLHRHKNGETMEVSVSSHTIQYRGKSATLLRFSLKRADSSEVGEAVLVERLRLTTQGMLCSAIGHEINNPLAAISGYARLIDSSGFVTPKIKECTKEIVTAADQIEGIVRYLRGMAQRKLREYGQLDLNHTIEEALSVFKRQLGVRDVQMELKLAPQSPKVWGDRYQIQNVFQNLVVRSRDAFESSKPGIKKEIRVSTKDNGSSVLVLYEDSADWSRPSGKYSSDLSGVRELLRRQHATLKQQQKNSGLQIEFPKERPSQADIEISETSNETPLTPGKKRLLIVDDNQALARLLAQLVGNDYRAHLCFDSRTAIQELTHATYDLILADLTLPDASGLEVLRYAKENSPDTPVIIITGRMEDDPEAQRALTYGAASVMYKPFPSTEKIRSALNEAMKKPSRKAG